MGRGLLVALGEDPSREGLRQTPARFARWWQEFIEYEAGNLETTFESVHADQMVAVSGIRVWSLCEHHLLPFWCDVAVGYLAKKRILGLSKLARIAHAHAHKLQVQERLVQQIADDIERLAGTNDVAVVARGEHLCMTMRGIKSHGLMVSSVMHGQFLQNPTARAEFLSIAQWRGKS